MKLVDLNILLNAVNEDAAHHTSVLAWWERAINGDEPVGLPWLVLLGFLRIATNRDIFPRPLDPDRAIAKVDAWLALDSTRLVRERDGHWDILRSLLAEAGTAANLVTDAHLAALAISHGAVLVSCDTDFARFAGLRWENPIADRLSAGSRPPAAPPTAAPRGSTGRARRGAGRRPGPGGAAPAGASRR